MLMHAMCVISQAVIKALTKYLLSVSGAESAELTAALSPDRCCGLLMHEQLLNLPIQIKPRLHEALRDDITWALANEVRIDHLKRISGICMHSDLH